MVGRKILASDCGPASAWVCELDRAARAVEALLPNRDHVVGVRRLQKPCHFLYPPLHEAQGLVTGLDTPIVNAGCQAPLYLDASFKGGGLPHRSVQPRRLIAKLDGAGNKYSALVCD